MTVMDCLEMRIGHETYLFKNDADVVAASEAMLKGAMMYSLADHTHPAAHAGIVAVETHIRRVPVETTVKRARMALGAGVRPLDGRRA